ncbi:MAG: ParB/RepB/Spo0J family partition protein [Pseudomonadales bacterium]|jgi:ParB family chromosome partitioning protein|nr:chromosome partitioning protein ParB [Gammaproteobacteria bacterium]MDP6025326.1 ParB/RepB/Spo0J family partition protein [Pseudomonadales bacterium]MDP6315080.1 ParB/RepB/Spo0J family partition protein [Pseudomonadales bacterium]MDP7315908.1 ParB/RepB/Spo0J family partition protein [Pseudomonadales bacterium]MDP7577250.1 ParB/RepB/Spo0J family partition protein [Pseudomonadales bacterium]|tara:strand:+ start:7848 stop:8717 length:870 start_codon:yes stop_codon:yes gene_type:complete
MASKKRGLGRGLDALLGTDSQPNSAEGAGSRLDEIPLDWIRPGRYQPRQVIDEEALQELADSIRAQGVMQPIVLRSVGENRYEIIAGERRWRATQVAGLEKIPAIVREVNDETAVAMSLIENIQREDLNPMEEALALQRLIEDFDLTHQQVADAVGKSRTAVTNFLRLINLSPDVAQMLAQGEIEMGHARALLSLSFDQQGQAAREIAAQHLNVRQTEAMVRKLLSGVGNQKQSKVADADTRNLENRLSETLGQPVMIQHSAKGKGKLVIKYNSLDELDGILGRIGDFD